ncbi:MAG: T9SS type A sorting domain-containing protein [Chitinophagaceae bacterium]|nr:T9SS type A sorting domain-containing protein [Chitinophagaceae bacterium]
MKKLLLPAFLLCFTLGSFAQNTFWKFEDEFSVRKLNTQRTLVPQRYQTASLPFDQYKAFLQTAPKEFSGSINKGLEISLPYPDKTFQKFRIVETKMMEDGLAAQFPGIRTFVGQGIDDPTSTIRIDFTYQGFHAYVLSRDGFVFIDPYQKANNDLYVSYFSKDYTNPSKDNFTCSVLDPLNRNQSLAAPPPPSAPCIGTQLRTYRAAVACTGEYAVAVCPVGNITVANTLSQIVTTMNRVVGVYEKEVDVRMILVASEATIIFINAATDPFAGNNNANTLINESETVIEANIGNANFDIGHTFSTGGGGLAALGVVCVNGSKASGITGSANPVGDGYDIDYVAHEMGHEFGCNHTFESKISNCGGGNRNGATAYEPGSGVSVMAYAGICGTDNIQPHSDPYFHTISYDELVNYTTTGSGNSCAVITATGNNPPVITMPVSGIKIPMQTPFKITASATDPDGDLLTYDWEEWDLAQGGNGSAWDAGANSTSRPLFKNRIPKLNGSRIFPDMAVILAGYPATPTSVMDGVKGETLAATARDIKYRLVVRDNKAGGGGVATGGNGCSSAAVFKVTVTGDGPFVVTTPNTAVNWFGGGTQTINWNVANTNSVAGINCQRVNILLSTDGGNTYPLTILSNTPNDGSQVITVPNIANTSTCRIMVQAADNIFFDISNVNFTITFSTVLPVSLLKFSVTPQRSSVQVNWSTTLEFNNKGFEVLRSEANSNNFVKIGFVNGAGTTGTVQNYSFSDANVQKGVVYFYRLRQIDFDGNAAYSSIERARLTGDNTFAITLQPQPFHDGAQLNITGLLKKNFTIEIDDATGKIIQNKEIKNQLENPSMPIELHGRAPGLYIIKIIQDNVVQTLRAIKQ